MEINPGIKPNFIIFKNEKIEWLFFSSCVDLIESFFLMAINNDQKAPNLIRF